MTSNVTAAIATPSAITIRTKKINDRAGTYHGVRASRPTVARYRRKGSRPLRRASPLDPGPAGRWMRAAAWVCLSEMFRLRDVTPCEEARTVTGTRSGEFPRPKPMRSRSDIRRFGNDIPYMRVCWLYARRITVTKVRSTVNTTPLTISPLQHGIRSLGLGGMR